jgi:hypothetical protein
MGGETLSYFVASYLERFPKKWDEIILKIKKEYDSNNKSNKWDLYLNIISVQKNIIWDIKVGIRQKK